MTMCTYFGTLKLIIMIILWTSICLQDAQAMRKPFEVVKRCPFNESEWKMRAAHTTCNGSESYHCLLTEGGLSLREQCIEASLITSGFCPIFTKDGYLQWSPCKDTACPASSYRSDEVYQYQICYRKSDNTKGENTEQESKDEGSATGVTPMTVIVTVIVILIVTVLVVFYYRNQFGFRDKIQQRFTDMRRCFQSRELTNETPISDSQCADKPCPTEPLLQQADSQCADKPCPTEPLLQQADIECADKSCPTEPLLQQDISPSDKSYQEIRIVLLGKKGTGKSATGNTILGKRVFQTSNSWSSITNKSSEITSIRFGKKLVVVDNPGIFDDTTSNEQTQEEINKCIVITSPGPHAFILVLSACRYTEQDQKSIEHYVSYFGEKIYKYVIVLFTRKDDLDNEYTSFYDHIKMCPPELRMLIKKCGGRVIAFNNRSKGEEQDLQAKQLLEIILENVEKNEGPYYTNEMYNGAKTFWIEKENNELSPSGKRYQEIRIVLLGRTGVGKSATGNTILGEKAFQSFISGSSIANKCSRRTSIRFDKKLVVVDTPGIFDTTSNKQIQEEIANCIAITSPGPHAFILVLSACRYTEEDQKSIEHLVRYFGEKMYKYFIVLFTRKDDLDEENTPLDDHIKMCPPELRMLIKKCGGRVIAFNNKSKGEEHDLQAKQLLEIILENVEKNDGQCYINEMYEEAEKDTKLKM